MSKENKEEVKRVSLETMTGVGKNVKIAGRDYLILPINIRDMHYVLGDTNTDENLIIVDKKKLDAEGSESLTWQLFGLNITTPKRKATFLYIINKYVYYISNEQKIPMTEELLEEHNWSFKDIGKFLYVWTEISD